MSSKVMEYEQGAIWAHEVAMPWTDGPHNGSQGDNLDAYGRYWIEGKGLAVCHLRRSVHYEAGCIERVRCYSPTIGGSVWAMVVKWLDGESQ
jgi:hypothetical protein